MSSTALRVFLVSLVVLGLGLGTAWAESMIPQDQGPGNEAGTPDMGPVDEAGVTPDQGAAAEAGVAADQGTVQPDGGDPPKDDDDGGCSVSGSGQPAGAAVLLLLGLGLMLRRRRR